MAAFRQVVTVSLGLVLLGCGFGGGGVTPIRTPFNKGVYHYAAGRWDAAIAEFRLALEDDGEDFRSQFNLAMALEAKAGEAMRSGEAEESERFAAEAEREYRVVIARRPQNVRAAVNLAACEYESGRKQEARSRLRAVIAAHPDAVTAQTALAAHLLREAGQASSLSEAQQKLGEAQQLLEQAVGEDAADITANMLLGDLYARRRQPQRAREAYRRALQRDASDIGTLLALARLESAQGEHADAVIWAQRVVYVDPNHVDAHLALATSFEAMEEFWRALVHVQEARELDHGPVARRSSEEYRARVIHLLERVREGERPSE